MTRPSRQPDRPGASGRPPRHAALLFGLLFSCAGPLAAQSFQRLWIDELLDGDHTAAEQACRRLAADRSQPTSARALALGRAAELARATGRERSHQEWVRELAALLERARPRAIHVPADPLPHDRLRTAALSSGDKSETAARTAAREAFLAQVDGTTRLRVYVGPILRLTRTARELEFAQLRAAIRAAESRGDAEEASSARRTLQRRLFGESVRDRVGAARLRIVMALVQDRPEDVDDLRARYRSLERGPLAARRQPDPEPDPEALRQEVAELTRTISDRGRTRQDALLEALVRLASTLREHLEAERWRQAEELLAQLPRTL